MTTLDGAVMQAEEFVSWLSGQMSLKPTGKWMLTDRLVEDLGLDSFDFLEITAILAGRGVAVEVVRLGDESTLADVFDQYVSATRAVGSTRG